MTDHKFTDDEIIKALECCSKDVPIRNSCEGCPFAGKKCAAFLPQTALDLINRQKAEIEEKSKNITFAAKELIRLDRERSEVIKEFAERLKPKLSYYDEVYVDSLVKEMTEGNHESQST